jgi:hypothetical protein
MARPVENCVVAAAIQRRFHRPKRRTGDGMRRILDPIADMAVSELKRAEEARRPDWTDTAVDTDCC